MDIQVVNLKVYKDAGYYIGRGSVLGNEKYLKCEADRDSVIEWYRGWLWREYKKRGKVYAELMLLYEHAKNNTLILKCFCKPKRCHGDVIKTYLEWMDKEYKK